MVLYSGSEKTTIFLNNIKYFLDISVDTNITNTIYLFSKDGEIIKDSIGNAIRVKMEV